MAEVSTEKPKHPSQANGAPWPIAATLLLACCLLCLRTPYSSLHGAITGEEGTVYLRFAWDTPILHALLARHQGYYSLYANLCGILAARVLPLEWAARFLFLAEAAIELLLVLVILQCERFRSAEQRAAMVLLALFAPPTASVILSTVNAQFFLAVITAVLLISDASRRRLPRLLLLLFAGFNGVLSVMLSPLFVWQAWKQKSRLRAAQSVALVPGGIAQAVVLARSHSLATGQHSKWGYDAGAVLVNAFLGHFFTFRASTVACKAVGSPKFAHSQNVLWLGMGLMDLALVAGLAWLLAKGGRAALLLASGALLSLAVALARAGVFDFDFMCGSGGRYFFIPNLLVSLGLVLVLGSSSPAPRNIARVLVLASLVSGVIDLRSMFLYSDLPNWTQEVAQWRANPEYRLRILPGFWPGLKLTPRHGNQELPYSIYDSTELGWRDR